MIGVRVLNLPFSNQTGNNDLTNLALIPIPVTPQTWSGRIGSVGTTSAARRPNGFYITWTMQIKLTIIENQTFKI